MCSEFPDEFIIQGLFMKSGRRLLSCFLSVIVLITVIIPNGFSGANIVRAAEIGTVTLQFPGGDGSSENPYQISNAQQLNLIRNNLSAYYVLIADIDMSDYSDWEPIGDTEHKFTGTLDGQNHIIKNLNIKNAKIYDRGNKDAIVGLFSSVSGEIKNLNISELKYNITYTGDCGDPDWFVVGGISAWGGTISNCTVSGNIEVEIKVNGVNLYVGGIVASGGQVSKCTSRVTINAKDLNIEGYSWYYNDTVNVGGISGYPSSISHCVNEGQISAEARDYLYCGGIAGQGVANQCINKGNIYGVINEGYSGTYSTFGNCNVGGISGAYGEYKDIINCVNYGNINGYMKIGRGKYTSSGYVGGIAGCAKGNIKNCYNLGSSISGIRQVKKNGEIVEEYSGNIGRIKGIGWGSVENIYSLDTTQINGYVVDEMKTNAKLNGTTLNFIEMQEKVSGIENIFSDFTLDEFAVVQMNEDAELFGKLYVYNNVKITDASALLRATIDWKSSDDSIAKVKYSSGWYNSSDSSIEVTIELATYKRGNVIITGTTSNGLTASCEVIVKASSYEIADFIIESNGIGYVKEESSIAGVIKLKEEVKNGDEILTEEIHNIKWTSSNQDIISDDDITCGVSSLFGGKTGKYNVKFTSQKCGHVTLIGTTSDGHLMTSAEITVVVSLKYRADGNLAGAETFSGTKSSNARHSYYYSDDFFYGNSTNYNNSLAVMTLGLELSSFSSPKYDDRYKDKIDEKLRAENIIDAYDKLGFEDAKYYNYDIPLSEDSDKAAYSFARKSISNGQSKDTLIAVVVRGGGYGAEWVSNFHVGNSGNAIGFDAAASEILPKLKDYINSTSIDGNLKLWITGFSRGGAIANILTHYINEDMVGVHLTLKQSNVFAYTFATPSGYRKANINSTLDSNIWNVVSANDLVPKLALVQWGFSKYGNTKVLPEYSSAALKKNFNTYTGEDFDIKNANNAEVALTDVLYDITLGTEGWTKTLEPDVRDALRAVYTESISDKTKFATEAIKAVDGVLKAKLGAYKLIYALSCVIGEELAYISTLTEEDSSIAHVMTNFAMAHYPEHYLCWLEGGNSLILKDGFYASLSQEGRDSIDKVVEGLFASTYKKYHFYCPVDVEVYDNSGKLVVNIVNNKVIIEDIPCYVDGDEKIVYLSDTGKYDIKLIGNDIGTMDYTVQEFNSESEVVRSVFYYDIPLDDGVIYTDSVEGNVLNTEEDYSITDGKTQLEPALDTIETDDDVKKYTISAKNGISSKSEAIKNESVSIVSIVDEGFKFVKWTSNLGDGIFDDPSAPSTRIRMPAQDIEIEAILESTSNSGRGSDTGTDTSNDSGGTSGTRTDVSNSSETDSFFKTNIESAKVTLKKNFYVYDGKKKQPAVTVKIGSMTLINEINYKVSYKNNKNIGKASVTIVGIGSYNGSITKTFSIVPKGTSLSKLSVKKKGFSVNWKKQAKFTNGYQIQYSTSKKFTGKATKIKTVKKNKTTKLTISKLKGKNKYYIRIRTYKIVKGKKYYSSWSKAKTVITK